MTSACPHCGKPVNPGARFCGSCGKTLQESKVTPPPQSEKTTCPHCGKPVRPDAKFCPSCGQSIPAIAAAVAAATPPVEGDSTQPEQQPPSPSEPAPPDTASSPAPPPKPFFSRYWWVILLVLLTCVILIPGGIIYSLDPFNWRATETPTATATVPESPISTGTEEEIAPTQTQSPSQTPVDTPAPPTEEPTSEPSATPEPETPTSGVTETQEATVTATQEVILEEDFEGDLQENWFVWGNPLPTTVGAPGQRSLNLDADPRAAGITSKEIITAAPGLEIKFNAALKEIAADNILAFDWDPGTESRNPDEKDFPGLIHIQIDENGAKLVSNSDGQECTQELNVAENHEYAIIFEQNRNVTFRIDNEQICTLRIQIRPGTEGRISFSGRGWIVSVTVGEIR